MGLVSCLEIQYVRSQALYSLRQDIGSASGKRAGFEEYVVEWGPLGNNGKGQKRSLREKVMGTCDRSTSSGYVAVVTAALLKDSLDDSKPCEDLVKLRHAREGVLDDFGTDSKPLCSTTVRSYTGGNVVCGHGKNEKSVNIDTNFLLRLIVNKFPRFAPRLDGPDRRRPCIIYYPCTFQPPGEYKAANPNHRKLEDYKDRVDEFASYFVEWCRLLARSTKAGGLKNMWPRPTGMAAMIADQFEEGVGISEKDRIQAYITEHLCRGKVGDMPASRDVIIKHAAETTQMSYKDAQQELRNQLIWSEKPYMTRVNGKPVKVHVFTFEIGLKIEAIATFKTVSAV